MAGPFSHPNEAQPPRHPAGSRLLRCIIFTILLLILLVGLAALVIWLVVRPASIEYNVEDARVRNYNLTADNHLNATFDITLRSDNHNRRVGIYYHSVDVTVWYAGQTLAVAVAQPFYQPKKNVTTFGVTTAATSLPLTGTAARRLRRDRSAGRFPVEVRVDSRVRFKVGAIKTKHYTMKVDCPPVMVQMSKSRLLQRTYCDVDI